MIENHARTSSISSPFRSEMFEGSTSGDDLLGSTTRSRNRSRMPATRMAATGTRVTRAPLPRVQMTTRSFRQKSWLTRVSAAGLTFHVSPRNMGNPFKAAIVRGMEIMIHPGGQPQRDEQPLRYNSASARSRRRSSSEYQVPFTWSRSAPIGQGNACPHAHFEDAASKALARLDDGAPSALEDCTEYQVVNRCPACIDLLMPSEVIRWWTSFSRNSKQIDESRPEARCDANHQIARANDQGQLDVARPTRKTSMVAPRVLASSRTLPMSFATVRSERNTDYWESKSCNKFVTSDETARG